jgi:DNA-binding transcriptional ArsR family regulator
VARRANAVRRSIDDTPRPGTSPLRRQTEIVSRAKAGPSAAARLDRVIHDRTRLSIMSALAANNVLSFTELKTLTSTTDGNLSVHARKLEDAGYVQCDKSFAGRTPRTDFRLTAAGRRALERYLDHMEALIRATRKKSIG